MAALGIDKAHIVGNSMGGQVAMKLGHRLSRPADQGRDHRQHADSAELFAPFPVEGIKMIARYYKGAGPSREKLRDLLQTIVYDFIVPDRRNLRRALQGEHRSGNRRAVRQEARRDTAREPDRRTSQAESQAARGLGHGRPLRRAGRGPADACRMVPERANAHLHQVRPLGAGRARRCSSTGWCSISWSIDRRCKSRTWK